VRVAIMTVAGPGETLVTARNGHKSSFTGMVLEEIVANGAFVEGAADQTLDRLRVVVE
jgi:arginine/lysine/ornithine decarboxylase